MKALLKFIFSVYLVLGSIVYLLTCLAPYINPCHSSVLYFSGLAFPLVFINFILIALYLGVIKKKFIFLFFLIPGILFALNYLSLGKTNADSSDGMTVYTLNTFATKLLHENESSFNAWNEYVTDEKNEADIICVQELPLNILKLFPSVGDYHVYSKKNSNLKIVSRYPILSGDELKDDTGMRFAIYADIKTPSETIRVYSFHLHSNKISGWLRTAEQTESPDASQLIKGGERIQKRIYEAAINRAKQSKKLNWHIAASPYKVIACGDMNETPQSFSYQQVKGDLYDTFRKGSMGTHPTYRKNPSWVRIDYIFTDSEFDVKSFDVLPFEISDHRALKTVIAK